MLQNEIPKDSIEEHFYNNKAVTWFQLHIFIHCYSPYIWQKGVQVQRTW